MNSDRFLNLPISTPNNRRKKHEIDIEKDWHNIATLKQSAQRADIVKKCISENYRTDN